ncbi:MAG: phosphoribosylamine--glycine ligase [Chitinivibrionales bacterium]|nr:phosphoribosylamine--glycine ligase [Chitinivibrionales bacterium]
MNTVLIVGNGGREHAILKALLRSDRALCIYAYPGNPGMEQDGCILVSAEIKSWHDLADWAKEAEIDLTIVGPEVPLTEGIVDIFKTEGLAIFGPSKKAAAIEGSKKFAKQLMAKYKIPTAAFKVFTDKKSAQAYCRKQGAPLVVKVSGLAAGKGAMVCDTMEALHSALDDIFDKKTFGDAGKTVVIEEKMSGEEASVFVLTDGKTYRVLPAAQDHKTAYDGDRGPNTGGMGAYAPAPVVDGAISARIEKEIIKPTIAAMKAEGCPYRGLLYAGVMITAAGPKVVEFNCRFGDPETQAVLPLVRCDWYEVFKACAAGHLTGTDWEIKKEYAVAVVLASAGYPGNYAKGKPVTGVDKAERRKENVDIYYSGISRDADGSLVTSGGRVASVAAWAPDLAGAIKCAYKAVDGIGFDGKMYRTDIGHKGLKRLKGS